jgi:hypothetical protein
MAGQTDDLWGAIDIRFWRDTPHLSGRLANEEDVKAGRAVYYVDRSDFDVKPPDLDLPRCGLVRDDSGAVDPVIVVQAESHEPGKAFVGFRPLAGGNGICTLDELELQAVAHVSTCRVATPGDACAGADEVSR